MIYLVPSPCCGVASWRMQKQFHRRQYRCPKCRHNFSVALADERKYLVGGTRLEIKQKKEKYHGKPAGRITVPQYRWGATRLG